MSAILAFLGSVIGALPKLLEQYRDWKREADARQAQVRKNRRNAEAIRNASRRDPAP